MFKSGAALPTIAEADDPKSLGSKAKQMFDDLDEDEFEDDKNDGDDFNANELL